MAMRKIGIALPNLPGVLPPLIPEFARRIEAGGLDAIWALVKLSVCESGATGVPGTSGSAIKLFYSELYQRIAELGMPALGRLALRRADVGSVCSSEIITKTMHSLSLTIAAGTSQIQRNIIAERSLGLPKEAR